MWCSANVHASRGLPFFAVRSTHSVTFGTFVVELCEDVEQKVRIAGDGDDDRKFVVRYIEFKCSAVQLDDLAKRTLSVVAVALGVDDLALVKRDVRQMHIRFQHEQPGHLA